METNVANKKKAGAKAKKTSTARQQKGETMQRNGAAAVAALDRFRQKKD